MSGIHLIGLHSNPAYQIHMKNTKVMDPSDFKGKNESSKQDSWNNLRP